MKMLFMFIILLLVLLILTGCQETRWECYSWNAQGRLIGFEKMTHRKCNVDSSTAELSTVFPSGAYFNASKMSLISDPNAMRWLSQVVEAYNGTTAIKSIRR